LDILNKLEEKERPFSDFKDGKEIKHNTQVDRVLKLLVRLALVSHIIVEIGPKEVSYYRINQRERDILELVNLMNNSSKNNEGLVIPS